MQKEILELLMADLEKYVELSYEYPDDAAQIDIIISLLEYVLYNVHTKMQ